MGLDSVEFLMAFEEEFGVTVTDAEAVLLVLLKGTALEFAWVGAVIAGCAGMRFTRRFENKISRNYSTVRDLVPFAITSGEISWSRDKVVTRVKRLVMKQPGVGEEEYREVTHFIHDFGMK
jgi:hypothetical protein